MRWFKIEKGQYILIGIFLGLIILLSSFLVKTSYLDTSGLENTTLNVNITQGISNLINSSRIIQYSPNGSEFICGVNNTGGWKCE